MAWRRRRSPGVSLEQLDANALLIIAVGVGLVVLTH